MDCLLHGSSAKVPVHMPSGRTHRRLGVCSDFKQPFLSAEALFHPEVDRELLVVEKVLLNTCLLTYSMEQSPS